MAMLRLTPDDLTEFQALYRAQTGKEITPAQAREYADRLIRLVAFLHDVDLSGGIRVW